MLGDIVGADVHSRGGRGGDHLDGHGLAVGTGDAVGLAFRCLNDELEVGHVGRDTGHGEGEGLALAGDGGGAGVLDTDECRRIADGGAAAGDDPVVEPGVQVAAGDLGASERASERSNRLLAVTYSLYCAKRGAERPRVCDWSAPARKEQSRSGAATSGVRRDALCPG